MPEEEPPDESTEENPTPDEPEESPVEEPEGEEQEITETSSEGEAEETSTSSPEPTGEEPPEELSPEELMEKTLDEEESEISEESPEGQEPASESEETGLPEEPSEAIEEEQAEFVQEEIEESSEVPEKAPEDEPLEEEGEPSSEVEEVPEEQTEDTSREEPEEEEAGEESGSIQDMLQEESRRVREEEAEPELEGEDEEEDEELPGGYLTVDQLPEEEEFKTPGWVKFSGYTLLGLLFTYFSISYLLLPMWENYHTIQVQNSIEQKNFDTAEYYTDRGMMLGGLLIHYPDAFVADFLKSLLENRRYDQFLRVHEEYSQAGFEGPRIEQMYVQYLLNRGKWKDALPRAEQLQTVTNIEVRGFGFLFRARALLELNRLSEARENLDQARIWLSNHPEVVRMERDLYIAEKDYERARRIAIRLRTRITEDDQLNDRARDYIQLARIYANLGRHQITEDMLLQALSLEPDHPVALRELTFRYILQDRWDRAESYILGQGSQISFRKRYPYQSFGWWSEAEFRLSTESYGEAVPLLERAKALNPRDPEIYRVYGRLHLERLQDPRQATRYFEQARRFGLDRLTFVEMLARSYYQSGQYSLAVEEYEKLLDNLEGNSLELTYNLGSSLLGAGQYDRAEALLDTAFDSSYRNQNIYNQRALLEELRGNPVDGQALYFEGIQWGERNNRPIQILRNNLDRSLAGEPPEPLTEFLAPVDKNMEIPYWERLGEEDEIGGL